MLGFLPGFPYLGGLDSALETPRLATPRTKIPAGAVGIGGAQTGIYPLESPGGWQLIGRTPVKVYDPQRPDPFLYRAGDSIVFYPVSAAEYVSLRSQSWE
jgi:KipI family sensor histidine kinase inhibitor